MLFYFLIVLTASIFITISVKFEFAYGLCEVSRRWTANCIFMNVLIT
jgi:hypothetical protein